MLALPHLTLAPLAFAAPPSSKGAAFNTLSELYPPTAYGARRLVARDAALAHASNENVTVEFQSQLIDIGDISSRQERETMKDSEKEHPSKSPNGELIQ